MNITKAVIPAAGLGTRFLPYTKAVPKEMLPLLNKPAIQLIIEEALASGINTIAMITSQGKQALANHFAPSPELTSTLEERNKSSLLNELNHDIERAHISYINQPKALGLGHAIWLARDAIGKEFFGIFLPDDIITSSVPAMEQLIKIAQQERASVIAVQEVHPEDVSAYGVIAIQEQMSSNLFHVSSLVEKPRVHDAPSNLAVIGRYVLSPNIFPALEEITPHATGELQLTDAISRMIANGEKVLAYKVQGTRYDIGNTLGWLKATIGIALQDPAYAPHIRTFLTEINALSTHTIDTTLLTEQEL